VLTADLVSTRRRGEELRLVALDAEGRVSAVELAARLLSAFKSCLGDTEEALTAALARVEVGPRDYRLKDALTKLLEDRCEFGPPTDADPEEVRREVFTLAASRRAALAPGGWNPRFSAIGRAYRYRILNRRSRPALLVGRVWHVDQPLDAEAMHRAAQSLLGRHDFTSFRASKCQAKSPLRTLDRLDVSRAGELIEFYVGARSFLHHQVRNMVGTLKLVGEGKWPESAVAEALAARDRGAAGPTAPPDGLALVAVRYLQDPFATD